MTPYEIREAESIKKSASFAQHYKTPEVQILQNKNKNLLAQMSQQRWRQNNSRLHFLGLKYPCVGW